MQPGYYDHVWVVEASRKYRAQRLRPDATTVAPGENAFFADVPYVIAAYKGAENLPEL